MKLTPGFTHLRRGVAAYRGVLRATPRSAPAWTCKCSPAHLTAMMAARCAQAEAERREQGTRDVFTLLNCAVCRKWWQDEGNGGVCPRCSRQLDRVKVVVTERIPA